MNEVIFEFSIIVWLFPIVFMLHEFEEIIFTRYWIDKNKDFVKRKLPKVLQRFLLHFESLSTPAFTVAVAEEFLLLSAITVISVFLDMYLIWLGVFMGFFVHLLVHLIQWIVLRRYIPAICTTVISLIYCVFSLYHIIGNDLFQVKEIALWTIIGFIIVAANLLFAHKLAHWFDRIINGRDLSI